VEQDSVIRFGVQPVEAQVKPDREWKAYPTRYLAQPVVDERGRSGEQFSQYGGTTRKRLQALGYFYAKKVAGRRWFVDPDGYLFIHKGVVSVAPGKSTYSQSALERVFGDAAGWAKETTKLLKDHGFNGTGSWSNAELLQSSGNPVAYTLIWNFMSEYGKERGGTYQLPGHTGYPNHAIFVFDREFAEFCDRHAGKLAATRDDPWLVGHFSDNELPFPASLLDNYLELDTSDAGHQAALAWICDRKKVTAAEFIKDMIDEEDRRQFIGYVADCYYSIVSQAIKKHDPNHMFLGSRIHTAKDNEYLFRAAGKYADAISVNYYGAWTPDAEKLRNWERWSGKPVMITEWYTKGMDAGLPNTTGAGWNVRTQDDRGLFYQNYALALLESRVVAGWHWFKYIDNDPQDLTTDPSNRDSNKGMVTIDNKPYQALLDRMKVLNDGVYELIDFLDAADKKE
jgi:hypothetical protein